MENRTDYDKDLANALKEAGMPNTAAYIEMFGDDLPSMWSWTTEKKEAFFKQCVEEKHPWDYYLDSDDEDAVL